MKGNEYICASVPILFAARRPSTVRRLIPLFIVYAFQFVFGRGTWANITVKLFKPLPLFAYHDTAPGVIRVAVRTASGFHASPHSVLRRFVHVMFVATVSLQAAARFHMTAYQSMWGYFDLLATNAFTRPPKLGLPPSRRALAMKSYSGESPKFLVRLYSGLRHDLSVLYKQIVFGAHSEHCAPRLYFNTRKFNVAGLY